jgi:ADP-heptose:LPS heptosyltransferase
MHDNKMALPNFGLPMVGNDDRDVGRNVGVVAQGPHHATKYAEPHGGIDMRFRTKQRVDFWLGGFLLLLLFAPVRLLGITLRRDHSTERRRGCVIVKLVGAGSLLLAMPALQAIRGRFPPGQFSLVGTREVVAFARGFDWFDRYHVIDDSSLVRLVASTFGALWESARHHDHLVDLEVHSRLTTAFSVLTGVRNRIGFVDEIVFWRRAFYTHMTFFNTHGPVYAFYDMLASWFDLHQIPVAAFNADFRERVLRVALPPDLRPPFGSIILAPACSNFGKEREITPPEWKAILSHDEAAATSVAVLGGGGDAVLGDAVIGELGGGNNLCGRLSLVQAARMIAEAERFYGIDSLLLHLARMLGVPVVSLWGPTRPATRLRPIATAERIAYVSPPCSPCIHVHETPPCAGARPCMAAAVAAYVSGATGVSTTALGPIGWSRAPDDDTVRRVSVGGA